MSSNPRRADGSRRDKIRDRWRAIGAPCWICGKPIDYSLGMVTANGKRRPHPMSFVVDEVVPLSRYREGGFDSAAQAATTFDNTRPAHWICNARRGDGTRRNKNALGGALPQPFDEW